MALDNLIASVPLDANLEKALSPILDPVVQYIVSTPALATPLAKLLGVNSQLVRARKLLLIEHYHAQHDEPACPGYVLDPNFRFTDFLTARSLHLKLITSQTILLADSYQQLAREEREIVCHVKDACMTAIAQIKGRCQQITHLSRDR